MVTNETYFESLKQIDFFGKEVHPELIPFVGSDYTKYRILHIGESHYLPNYHKGKHEKYNEITFNDFKGWWEGRYSEALRHYSGWYNTEDVVKWYMDGHRDKSHGIFTNTLRSFCKIVVPNEAFEEITTENSKKYNYFAFMNFYQYPSMYYGYNFTNALYCAGKYLKWSSKDVDKMWYDIFYKSENILKKVIDVLQPKAIAVTSSEVSYYLKKYGDTIWKDNQKCIWLDHPGCSWWYRKKQDGKSSKERFEEAIKEIYG